MGTLVIEHCHIATCNEAGAEYADGHLVVDGGRISSVGPGPAPAPGDGEVSRVDGRGCLLTPGLINTHHHLFQWVTRAVSQNETLFGWLTTLYPVWARIDERPTSAGWR
jgi:cytosine/adenosine deaminase-related metal-dependent hydrolase